MLSQFFLGTNFLISYTIDRLYTINLKKFGSFIYSCFGNVVYDRCEIAKIK
jgi:hypothetical protein